MALTQKSQKVHHVCFATVPYPNIIVLTRWPSALLIYIHSSICLCMLWRLIILNLRRKDTNVKLIVSSRSSMFCKFWVSRHWKFFQESQKGRTTAHNRTWPLVSHGFVLLSHCCELRNLQQKKKLEKSSYQPAREREREWRFATLDARGENWQVCEPRMWESSAPVVVK